MYLWKIFWIATHQKNGNIVNKTKEFKSVYKNLSNIDVLKSTGSSSGCVGSSVGSSANSSSTRSSSSGNGSGSFGSGSNSSSSQDFNKRLHKVKYWTWNRNPKARN